jgi:SAM-dependent methyltransferase
VSAARRLRILPTVEYARFLKAASMSFMKNRRFFNQQPPPHYIAPPIWLAYDAYNNLDFAKIYAQGKAQAEILSDFMKKHLPARQLERASVLEWGCGPGRILQHMPSLLGSGVQLFGSDYNPTTVAWCQGHLHSIECRLNSLAPPLAFSTGSLDVVYAISVFTHLSERLHVAWIDELLRVLRPGGLLLVTLHGNCVANRLNPTERSHFDRGELVLRGQVKEGSRLYAAFHPDDYVRKSLLTNFEILEKLEPFARGMDQTLWVARKQARADAQA